MAPRRRATMPAPASRRKVVPSSPVTRSRTSWSQTKRSGAGIVARLLGAMALQAHEIGKQFVLAFAGACPVGDPAGVAEVAVLAAPGRGSREQTSVDQRDRLGDQVAQAV